MTKIQKQFRLLFTTDLHLDFCEEEQIRAFCDRMKAKKPDGIVITGDISNAIDLKDHLGFLDVCMGGVCPIFFILGNHDYYGSSIAHVRSEMDRLFVYTDAHKAAGAARLGYLGNSGVIPLTEDTALVGHDGWYDGLYADWFRSNVQLRDYYVIQDLDDNHCPLANLRFAKLMELARISTEYVTEQTEKAFVDFDHVFVATHVPPFRESAVYNGKISDSNWMPHFSSMIMGDALRVLANKYPQKRLTVLCGHSHGSADVSFASNLRCLTGFAEYHNPMIVKIFEL